MSGRPSAFVWLRRIAELAAEQRPPFDGTDAARVLAFAIRLGLDTKGSTGDGAHVPTGIASRPTTYRYLSRLVDARLVERTGLPTRARAGRPGRRAVYGLVSPPESCLSGERESETRSANRSETRLSTTDPESCLTNEREALHPCEEKRSSSTARSSKRRRSERSSEELDNGASVPAHVGDRALVAALDREPATLEVVRDAVGDASRDASRNGVTTGSLGATW